MLPVNNERMCPEDTDAVPEMRASPWLARKNFFGPVKY